MPTPERHVVAVTLVSKRDRMVLVRVGTSLAAAVGAVLRDGFPFVSPSWDTPEQKNAHAHIKTAVDANDGQAALAALREYLAADYSVVAHTDLAVNS